MFRKVSLNFGLERVDLLRQRPESGTIDGIGDPVMGAECDITVASGGCKISDMAGIEFLLIDGKTDLRDLRKELRSNEVYYHTAKGFSFA